MICCIASKGRPDTKTYELFKTAGIETYHFVEPQDVASYASRPNVIDIKCNGRGLAYVRNFILDWSRRQCNQWVVMCDDDVSSFGFYDGKNRKIGAEIWHEIFQRTKGLPFEIIGINYRQHAWHEKTKTSINKKFADVCVLLDSNNLTWRFDESFKMKADRDFVMQTIKNGFGTIRFNKYFHESPEVGTNNGGLHENYAAKCDTQWAIKLVEKWHPYAKLTKKAGRVDAKIDIAAFARAHKKAVK
mgnify:CR=1 FL=1|jgi:hypothetical protein|tara:strand:- start:842 stop:1576 length:735 start_codon:yes stop_codon:yes gene_type:complete